MEFYDKINAPYKRYTDGPDKGKFMRGQWSTPEIGYLADAAWRFTEKIDGTNTIVEFENNGGVQDTVTFGGRTARTVIPVVLLDYLEEIFKPEMFWQFDMDKIDKITLYGEGLGGKIQGGLYGPTPRFVLFDVNIDGWWLSRDNVVDIAHKLTLDVVAEIGVGSLWDGFNLVQAGFNSKLTGVTKAEGVIARPMVDIYDRAGKRIVTKIKRVDFK